MVLAIAIFFDTVAHRNSAAVDLVNYISGYPGMVSSVEDRGVSGGALAPQIWATLDVPVGAWQAKHDQLVTIVQNNKAAYGVQSLGVNGHLVTI